MLLEKENCPFLGLQYTVLWDRVVNQRRTRPRITDCTWLGRIPCIWWMPIVSYIFVCPFAVPRLDSIRQKRRFFLRCRYSAWLLLELLHQGLQTVVVSIAVCTKGIGLVPLSFSSLFWTNQFCAAIVMRCGRLMSLLCLIIFGVHCLYCCYYCMEASARLNLDEWNPKRLLLYFIMVVYCHAVLFSLARANQRGTAVLRVDVYEIQRRTRR